MKIFHPETFQGSHGRNKYFEGWYFKVASPPEIFAFIPGISLGDDPHSFIQIIDGRSHNTNFLRFPLADFECTPGTMDVKIGNNTFSKHRIVLNEERESANLHGELNFSELSPYPSKLFSAGIMGPFTFVPFMECYHGLVSAAHKVNGELNWNNRRFNINDGRGYIEKDWGRSMPSSWIWIQCNFFEEPETSIMISIAKIPWLGKSFIGHLGYFYHHNKFYSFATYNNSKFQILKSGGEELVIKLWNRNYSLEASVTSKDSGGTLLAPVNGGMQRSIKERTDAVISIKAKAADGTIIFEGDGSYCGIEITGNYEELKA